MIHYGPSVNNFTFMNEEQLNTHRLELLKLAFIEELATLHFGKSEQQ